MFNRARADQRRSSEAAEHEAQQGNPDGKWDADRNTHEFIAAMPEWRNQGLLAFTLNLQGGSPEGYSHGQPWINFAFNPDGSLREDCFARLEKNWIAPMNSAWSSSSDIFTRVKTTF